VPQFAEMRDVLVELRTGRLAPPALSVGTAELSPEGIRDRQLVLSYEMSRGFGAALASGLAGEERRVWNEARAAFPDPSEAAWSAARERIRAERARQGDLAPSSAAGGAAPPTGPAEDAEQRRHASELLRRRLKETQQEPDGVVIAAATGGAAAWLAAACLSALVLPGGLTARLFGLALRRRNGRRGGRWIGFVRALASGIGPFAGYAIALGLTLADERVWSWVVLGTTLALHAAGLALTLVSPARGPVDRLLGTRLVPR